MYSVSTGITIIHFVLVLSQNNVRQIEIFDPPATSPNPVPTFQCFVNHKKGGVHVLKCAQKINY